MVMNFRCVIIIFMCFTLASMQAALNNPPLVNPSFEDPALAADGSADGAVDWYDSVAYTYTKDEEDAAAIYPETPYGDNWGEMGNGRWFYQQVGTYSENVSYDISFIVGQIADSGKPFVGLTVELLAGGNPTLAADVNEKRGASFSLETTVGAVVIASSGQFNPFSTSGVAATSEQSFELNTGTVGAGYAVGDPLWLLVYRPSEGGRSLIDNVAVTVATSEPTAVNPAPAHGAEHIDIAAAMAWNVQNATNPTFDINIGTDSNCNDIITAHSTGSTQSYTPSAGLLDYATQYFWQVDVTDGGTEYTGPVWSFTTGGKAFSPVPVSGGIADRSTGMLNWSGEAFIASYDVWFGSPGNLQSVGSYTATSVSFTDLAAAIGRPFVSAGDYQWRVDTRDGSGALMVSGDIWDVTFPEIESIVIEDFNGYNQTSELLANWNGTSGAVLTKHDFYGAMQFDYDTQATPYKSEATLTFAAAQDWAATFMDTFKVTIRGQAGSDAETFYCTLNDGTTTATVTYPQLGAATTETWQDWYIRLSDFSEQGLSLASVTSVTIGIGDGNSPGGSGNLYIDDLLIDLPGCISAFQPQGDLNKDCQVTFDDIIILARDWLLKDFSVAPVAPDAVMLLAHYEFNETSGSTASDSTANNYHASIAADDSGGIWNSTGHDGGCIEFDSSVEVTIPAGVFGSVTDEVTISVWVNGDAADYPGTVNQMLFAAGPAAGDEYGWEKTAWDIDDAGAYGGQWNHYAAVKNAASGIMSIYHNGVLVGRNASAIDILEGALAGDSILTMARIDAGTTSTKVDDLRIYGYALSQAEIVHLAGDSIVQPIVPIYTLSELGDDGRVSLPDFAVIAQQWLEQK